MAVTTKPAAAPSAALRAAGTLAAATFGLASRARGKKSLHPEGVVHEATLTVTGAAAAPAGVPLLSDPREHAAIVRFSRGAGLPAALPDVLGLALRLPDVHGPGGHQDLLLATSGNGPLVHHLLLPAPGFLSLPYSSILPYRGGDGSLFLVGAMPRGRARRRSGGDEYDALARAAASGGPAFDIGVAAIGGRLRPVASLTLGPRLEPEANALRFNPWNTGGGLEPAGFFNWLRDFAYPGSQAGWQGADPRELSAR